jgi:hypothetical protein
LLAILVSRELEMVSSDVKLPSASTGDRIRSIRLTYHYDDAD